MYFECTTLVLDLDGTISDPSLGTARCFNHALQSHGLPTLPKKTIADEIGSPLDETFLKLTPGIDTSVVTSLVTIYRERYSDVGFSENLVYPGIPSALAHIHNSGLRLGVCTSKCRDFAEKILSHFGLLEHFDFVDGGDIGITKSTQLAGLVNTGTINDQAIMVGDRAVDIISAQKNGLRSIGVLWGFGSHKEVSESSPTAIIEKVEELPILFI